MDNVNDMVYCVHCDKWFRAQQIASRFYYNPGEGLCDGCDEEVRNKKETK